MEQCYNRYRPYFPRDATDFFAFFFMNFGFCSITYYEIFHVLPTVDKDSQISYTYHLVLGIYFLINIYGNYIKVITTDSSTRRMMLPTLLKPDWRYCYTCECNSPPRSWHCLHCNACILRRDHHCTFAGVCVGHKNYRYFLCMLFWLTVAGTYINVVHAEYAYDILGGLNFESVIAVLFPWMAWMFGLHGPFSFFVALMSSLVLFGTILSGAYLAYLMNYLRFGQTNFEYTLGQGEQYNIGLYANLKQLFGKNWKICWLLPWIPSHLYTDGTRFLTQHDEIELKAM